MVYGISVLNLISNTLVLWNSIQSITFRVPTATISLHILFHDGFIALDAPRRKVLNIMSLTVHTIMMLTIAVIRPEFYLTAIELTLKMLDMPFLVQSGDVGSATSKTTTGAYQI
jgi:hypothetical protein